MECRATIALSLLALSLLALALPAKAETTTLSAPVGTGGGHVTGASVEAQLSIGDAVAGGLASSGNIEDKGGYTGQLYDVESLTITATPTTVPETGTRQLGANPLLDDDTTLAPDAADITWSVLSGAIAGVDSAGLATAAAVYEDSPAVVFGSWCGVSDTIDLTVIDALPDNFGSYAGDGIDDGWQVGFFGLDNPDAAPGADPDHDSQDNLFEFLALVDPSDPLSLFCAEMSSRESVTFSPFSGQRTYSLLASPDLNPANFAPVSSSATDNGGERTLTHTAPPGGARLLYKVEISDQ